MKEGLGIGGMGRQGVRRRGLHHRIANYHASEEGMHRWIVRDCTRVMGYCTLAYIHTHTYTHTNTHLYIPCSPWLPHYNGQGGSVQGRQGVGEGRMHHRTAD